MFHICRESVRLLIVALFLLALSSAQVLCAQEHRVSKQVVVCEAISRTPIPNAVLHIGTRQYLTDSSGNVLIHFLASDKELTVSHLAYESRICPVQDLLGSSSDKIFIDLYSKSEALEEVVVLAQGHKKSLSVSEMLSAEDLSSNLGSSLAEAISKVKGVSILSTGPNSSKPVIHGMHSNRVMIVNNGIRHIGQNWGIEQSPELDFSMAENVRVIKGAEVVKHGSGALGGVVEVDVPTLKYNDKIIGGDVSASYSTNGRSILGLLSLHGSIGKHWAWEVQGGLQNSGDKQTAEYLLNNTGSRLMSGTLHVGYQSERFQSDALLSYFDNKDATMLAWQIGSQSLFEERLRIGRPPLIYPFTREITYPYSHIKHILFNLRNKYHIGDEQMLMLHLSHQINNHKDYHNRRNYRSNVPEFSMLLKTSDALLTWNHFNLWGSRLELGGEVQFSRNDNPDDTGVTPMIPNYVELVTSLFGWQKKQWNKLTMDWGVRWERYYNAAAGYDFSGDYYEGNNLYYLLGGQVGVAYQQSEAFSLVSGLSILQRAPHVYERYSLGVDKASGVFSKGLHDLTPEVGYKGVLAIEGSAQWLSWSVEGFLQYVQGYIYQATNREHFTTQAGTYPIFDYRQEDSMFRGVDVKLGAAILGEKLYYGAQGGMIVGKTKSQLFIPNIAPFRLRQWVESKHQFRLGAERLDLSASVEHQYTAKQRCFSPEMDLVDFTPPAYHIMGASVTGTFHFRNQQSLALQISVDNLWNKLYKDYTNRFRYYFHDLGRNVKMRLTWSF